MKARVGLWQLGGFAATVLMGTVLHFLYDWLGEATWSAPFSGVNESTWEHMKLLFWPMLAFALVQSRYFKDKVNFWCIKLKAILLGLSLIPIMFYTYNGAIGKSPDWINITIFFISATISFIFEARQLKKDVITCKNSNLALFLTFAIAFLFVLFTFYTPQIGIFKDPITGGYGI